MKKILLFLIALVAGLSVRAQVHINADTVKAPATYENIWSKQVASDSLSTTYVIYIKTAVKKHQHLHHTENVVVLEGEGEMVLGNETFRVKKGDVIFIPQKTPHAVKVLSKHPLKVLSIQSPRFDGSDRMILE